jgi:hypothetical protein
MMEQDEGTCNLREIALNLHAPMHARSSTMSLRLLVSLVNPIFEPTCLLVLRGLSNGSIFFANRPADLLGVVPTVGMYSQLFLLY